MREYGSCISLLHGVCTMHVCVVCAVNGKRPCPGMRLCAETDQISCTVCKIPGTVVAINMIGRILRICDMSCYMCPMCLRFNVWRGDGTDLCCESDGCEACVCDPFKDKCAHSLASQKICAVCEVKVIYDKNSNSDNNNDGNKDDRNDNQKRVSNFW